MATQLTEQLLKVRQRDLLALADGRQGNGAVVLAQGQVNHCSDRKAAFGREAHFQAPLKLA
jgi:hypothetical protein